MKQNSFSKKRIIRISIIIFIFIIILLSSIFLIFRYNEEGEENLPFNIKKINIISTAQADSIQEEADEWHAQLQQKNDIFFVIEKNSLYKKEDIIKKISFENFIINKKNEDMVVDFYRPNESVNTYVYSDEYKIENSLEYIGGQNTSAETLQINNQGGVIGFSIISDNIGEYTFGKNEKVPSDGKLLAKAGINEDNIKFQVSFDIIIETESNHKFKSNIVLDLPTGNILEEGVGILEDTELTDVVFKRF